MLVFIAAGLLAIMHVTLSRAVDLLNHLHGSSLQNAGMAAGLAKSLGKVATLGLVPIVFGPVMNISASILANWWSKKPVSNLKVTSE